MKIWLLPLALLAVSSSASLADAPPRAVTSPPLKPGVVVLSNQVATALKQNNMSAVSRHVDWTRGLRFSPEVFAQKSDVKLSRSQVAKLRTDKKIRTWGTYDGEGGPIRLNWAGYRKRYVWSRDFTKGAKVSVNRFGGGRSTIINNLRQFYPNATFVEYYLPASSPNTMDWASLWMVWKKTGGTWRLIGIAHDQWST